LPELLALSALRAHREWSRPKAAWLLAELVSGVAESVTVLLARRKSSRHHHQMACSPARYRPSQAHPHLAYFVHPFWNSGHPLNVLSQIQCTGPPLIRQNCGFAKYIDLFRETQLFALR
jgi:hypothetical protein